MASGGESLRNEDSAGHHDSERPDSRALPSQGEQTGASVGPLNVQAIHEARAEPPPADADPLTKKQILKLTLKQRIDYEHIELIERLDRGNELLRKERDEHKSECTARLTKIDALREELHKETVKHVELKTIGRGDRWKDTVTSFLSVVGGALISTFGKGSSGFALGWAFLGLAALFQLGRAFWKTP